MPSDATIALLERIFARALEAAHPQRCLPSALRDLGRPGSALVLGAGKAAASMAACFASHWDAPVRGMVVTRYEHGLQAGEDARGIEIVEAGHPSPDTASLEAGAKLLELARSLRGEESLYCLISGGGSALAAAPLPGLDFGAKRDAGNFLIRTGAHIREINCVRKHLSGLKGGRLASAAHPAPVRTFAISDVPGDNIADVASGPTLPDSTTQRDALEILKRYRYPNLRELQEVLLDPTAETPKPGDPAFERDHAELIATAATALDAAAVYLAELGYAVLHLGDDLADEAETLGREHAQIAKARVAAGERVAILSGGETRVVLSRSGGKGGRNLEYLSGLALGLEGQPGVSALAADTDGIDGRGDHAGGFVVPDILAREPSIGSTLAECLHNHDSYRFFEAADLLFKTGPTRTNVNDFRVILCQP